ncbi:hypothetical protein JL101_027720 [Skermanella rosea]|uniref:DUF2283 domain-containing protein n=1 Tax=Skermanella cutis TaxID=2775420 RepID=A0ABX7B5W0_9PROT|nr:MULTISPECIES: hypothetical protein [Skermanella]QQP89547.1 hypothetical protein IGS68_26865 [Skermanella sp. TT6]UEM03692.1 hypothetical protein JL101_027720 [Skermanella rosea]
MSDDRVQYDVSLDILQVRIRPIKRSYTLICHSRGNHSIDLDEAGRVVGWTILDASKQPEIIGEALAMLQQSLNVRREDAPIYWLLRELFGINRRDEGERDTVADVRRDSHGEYGPEHDLDW